ncbi:MAG: hypothetical protein V1894_06900 [Chloroflexota bacterium]
MESKLEAKMKTSLVDGKLPCAVCFQLAREFNVPVSQIGELANKLNLRVSKCQLGLFK